MKKHSFIKYAVPLLLCSLSAIALSVGCVNIDDVCKAKYEKTETLSAPFAPDQTLELENNVGEITITGADVKDCKVTAVITAKAETEEKAQKLAEEVRIKLEPSGNKLLIRTETPANNSEQSVAVDFNITVPKQTALQLTANVGKINITSITRPIKAETNVGAVSCKEITGDINIKTNVGEVTVLYSKTAPSDCNANIETGIGEINFTAPPDLSVKVDFSTTIGAIQTDLPLNITGTLGKKTSGTVGKGQGKVTLKTNIGSIKIK